MSGIDLLSQIPINFLLIILIGLMLIVLIMQSSVISKLNRLPSYTKVNQLSRKKKERSKTSSTSMFEEFLKEDPTRKSLTKSEQFVAYRAWRREKGLNWSS